MSFVSGEQKGYEPGRSDRSISRRQADVTARGWPQTIGSPVVGGAVVSCCFSTVLFWFHCFYFVVVYKPEPLFYLVTVV